MPYDNIPIIVVLWQHSSYGGKRTIIINNELNMNTLGFNDITSSIGIHPGPNYNPNHTYRVAFYEGANYQGCVLTLTQGAYPCLVRPYNFNDIISSVRIWPPLNTNIVLHPHSTHTISPIPLVAEIFEHSNYRGKKLTIVENIANIHSYADFGDIVTSVKVHRGPNYVEDNKVKLYGAVNYRGGHIELDIGNYPNIGTSHGFNDVVSSVRIR